MFHNSLHALLLTVSLALSACRLDAKSIPMSAPHPPRAVPASAVSPNFVAAYPAPQDSDRDLPITTMETIGA